MTSINQGNFNVISGPFDFSGSQYNVVDVPLMNAPLHISDDGTMMVFEISATDKDKIYNIFLIVNDISNAVVTEKSKILYPPHSGGETYNSPYMIDTTKKLIYVLGNVVTLDSGLPENNSSLNVYNYSSNANYKHDLTIGVNNDNILLNNFGLNKNYIYGTIDGNTNIFIDKLSNYGTTYSPSDKKIVSITGTEPRTIENVFVSSDARYINVMFTRNENNLISYTKNNEGTYESNVTMSIPRKNKNSYSFTDNNEIVYLSVDNTLIKRVISNESTIQPEVIKTYADLTSIHILKSSLVGNKITMYYETNNSLILHVFTKQNSAWIQVQQVIASNTNIIATNYNTNALSNFFVNIKYINANSPLQGTLYDYSLLSESTTITTPSEDYVYFKGDLEGVLAVDSAYKESETASIYTFSQNKQVGRTKPQFYVKFWVDIDTIKNAIDISYNSTGGTLSDASKNALVAELYDSIDATPTHTNLFKFNELTYNATGNSQIVDGSNIRFKEMKWNNNSVKANVSLPDFFVNPVGLTISPQVESKITVTIDVSGITTYDVTNGNVKLPYKLTADPTNSRTYRVNDDKNKINIIKTNNDPPGPSESSQLYVEIAADTALNESSSLECKSSLTKIKITDEELNAILYDLILRHKNSQTTAGTFTFTFNDVKNLINNNISGIVSVVDNVPLNFYVAVKLFNNTSGAEKINGVGAATDVTNNNPLNLFTTSDNKGRKINNGNVDTFATTIKGMQPPAKETLATKTVAPDANFEETTDLSQPGIISSRKLFIWIVFKSKQSITNVALPVNPVNTQNRLTASQIQGTTG